MKRDPSDTLRASRASRLRGLFAAAAFGILGAVLCGALTGCASTEGAAEDEPAAARAQDLTATQLARELGLRVVRGSDGNGTDGPVRLEAYGGAHVLLYPGTSIASVAGRSLSLSQPLYQAAGHTWLSALDADAVRAAWYEQVATGSVAGGTSPGGSYRVPIPDRPSSSGPTPPRGAPAPSAAWADNRPTATELAAWTVALKRRWNYIVVHHSASAAGNAASIDRAHKDRGFDGLGYDFVIGNGTSSPDGAVEVGYRWRQQLTGAHAKTAGNLMNEQGIGICLVGNFDITRPTPAQMRSLDRLTAFLAQYCGIAAANLRMHGEVKATDCPGKYFPRDFAIRTVTGGARTAWGGGDGATGTR